jgi:CDP-glucose 4,6-dehydratase
VNRPALPSEAFWKGQRVFLTGHTGFKGGWTAVWLRRLGAEVCGYALAPSTAPSLFTALRGETLAQSNLGDVRDLAAMKGCFDAFDPTLVLHMAAQPLVRQSYVDPVGTYSTNVMGTVNVLELARSCPSVAATLVVTSDKCYENREQMRPYQETDRLGGRDPYSSSKACAELVTASYWWSYFRGQGGGLGSARAGNVIGGGDWSPDRLAPDLVAAFSAGRPAILRRPESIRPWQHVAEPVCGYLLVLEALAQGPPGDAPPAWNFGPAAEDCFPVGELAARFAKAWGDGAVCEVRRDPDAPHEATLLTLDHGKAGRELGWRPRWPLATAVAMTAQWHLAYNRGEDMLALTQRQIDAYIAA